jgi:hypothetical protein
MEKWLLLLGSVVAVAIAVKTVRWWDRFHGAPTSEIEKVVGYDGSWLGSARDRVAQWQKTGAGSFPLVLALAFAAGMVLLTIRAFLA